MHREAVFADGLRRAGVVVLGKANLSELAGAVAKTPGVSAVGGQTTNPYGAAFSPGGSSSGSAVSVADEAEPGPGEQLLGFAHAFEQATRLHVAPRPTS